MSLIIVIIVMIGLGLFVFSGCVQPESVVEDETVEEVESPDPAPNDEVEEDEKAEELADGIYIDMEGPLAPRISGAASRKAPAPLSPERDYFLGSFAGALKLLDFPGQGLVWTYEVDEALAPRQYIWHPGGEAFLLVSASEAESESEAAGALHLHLIGLDGDKRKITTLDGAIFGTDTIDLAGADYRVGFLDWALQGEAIALDLHYEEYSSILVIDLHGDVLLEKQFDDRSFLRAPLSSPDGRQLAFTRFGWGAEDLFLLDLESGRMRQVSESGEGNYPYLWLDQEQLLVILGAIGPGGGYHYGIALMDSVTGEQEWAYAVDYRYNMYYLSAFCPAANYVLGTERDGAGTSARISIVEPQSGEKDYLVDDFNVRQAEWISEDRVIMNLAGWQDSEEAYQGREDYHILATYSPADGLTTQVESEEPLYLLGVADEELHYLEPAEDYPYWVWQVKSLD